MNWVHDELIGAISKYNINTIYRILEVISETHETIYRSFRLYVYFIFFCISVNKIFVAENNFETLFMVMYSYEKWILRYITINLHENNYRFIRFLICA